MKANIVLAGGGAKGAVLAGCVNAAVSKGVQPTGFGGTSAGAIVAFLASIGFRDEKLQDLLVSTNLADLLDDEGAAIEGISKDLGWLGNVVEKWRQSDGVGSVLRLALRIGWHEMTTAALDFPGAVSRRCWGFLANIPGLGRCRPAPRPVHPRRWTAIRLAKTLFANRGLHSGDKLRGWLVQRLVERGIATADEGKQLTFADLAVKQGCVPLRVVVTDVHRRQPVVFGRNDGLANLPVVDAVVASARFPLLFQPDERGGMSLTDGGLSSNLPAFLFEDAYAATRTKTMAFDLIEDQTTDAPLFGEGIGFLKSLASCALEASDVLLRQTTAGIEYYAIPVPPGVGVFSLRMDLPTRHACYDRGFAEAAAMLEKADWYMRMRLAGDGLKAELVAEHGDPDIFEPILRAIMDQISSRSEKSLEGGRASIALVTSRGADQKRIITYSLNMDDDPDSDLELDATAGCSGQAWQECNVAFADVAAGRANPEAWGMTAAQYAKIPLTIRSAISAPIVEDLEAARPGMQPVGTISVDCRTPLADIGWIDRGVSGDEFVVDPEIEAIVAAWVRVLHALLVRPS